MLNSLKARQTKTHLDSTTTKQGIQYYNGSADGFHEWEFRTMAKYNATKADERFQLGARVLEGLVDQAYQVAYDFGLDNLKSENGAKLLVERMKEKVFPRLEDEAKKLYRVGQDANGVMSRQSAESMVEYISRRERWYEQLLILDPQSTMSETIRADLLLEMCGITKPEKLMVITSIGNKKNDIKAIAEAWEKQHPYIHMNETPKSQTP